MTEPEFIEIYEKNTIMLEAWGRIVTRTICDKLTVLLPRTGMETFLKLPVIPRVKSLDSAIEKAFVRKSYANPYEDLTDKVGIRFVVLLTDEIEIISSIIENESSWEASKDRDYEYERDASPEHFSYQSIHFIVRSKQHTNYDGIDIPERTPCEIQIRSLMQHAYSELTHDTIYKTKVITTPIVKRYVARSMALIETTDELFVNAKKKIQQEEGPQDVFLQKLQDVYITIIGANPINTKSELMLIDSFRDRLPYEKLDEVSQFFANRHGLIEIISERRSTNLLYRNSVILVVYFLVFTRRKYVKQHWPLGSRERDLEQIFVDLGYAYTQD